MVKLRLRRKGRIRKPFYDIVAVDSRRKRDGLYIEQVGTYDPMTQPSTAVIDHERAIYWLGVGAQPTDRVRSILSFEGVLLRRNLLGKEKPVEEVDAAVATHKEHALKRYHSEKYKRKQKELKAAEAAQKVIDDANAAAAVPAPVAEAPAES